MPPDDFDIIYADDPDPADEIVTLPPFTVTADRISLLPLVLVAAFALLALSTRRRR